jgi:formate/nitrite transporter FocA (FNT family)
MPDNSQKSAEEPKKSYSEILEQEIEEGLRQLERRADGLFLSSLSGGLDLGFSALLMGVVLTLGRGQLPDLVVDILVANAYTIGFVFVVVGRSELFTEHTTLAVLPVLDRQATIRELGRLWVLVYLGNVLGGAIFAVLAALVGQGLGRIEPAAFGEMARLLTEQSTYVILLSAILAGWLMGLLSWLVVASRDTISQIAVVWLVTGAIGLVGLHHSIAGTVEVLAGVFAVDAIPIAAFGRFLLWTTLGNAIGGVVFVAILKYVHVVRGGSEKQSEPIESKA